MLTFFLSYLSNKVERVSLDHDVREEEVDDLLGREFCEPLLDHVLHDLPQLEPVRGMVIQLACADNKKNVTQTGKAITPPNSAFLTEDPRHREELRRGEGAPGVDKVLRHAPQDGGTAHPEVEAVVADGGDEVALLDLAAADLEVFLHHAHHVVVDVLQAADRKIIFSSIEYYGRELHN